MDDTIRVCTYHRRDFDLAVTRLNPRVHDAVPDSLARPFNCPAVKTLGQMQILPVEILFEILLCLDLRSLFVFQSTSGLARSPPPCLDTNPL